MPHNPSKMLINGHEKSLETNGRTYGRLGRMGWEDGKAA